MKLYNDDCLKVLKDIPDESIDLVCTDCPYHIVQGGCTTGLYGNPSGVLNHDYTKATEDTEYTRQGKIFKHNDIKFEEWLPEIYRVLKQDTHCYIMVNARNLAELQTKAEKVGFQFQNILIWFKNNATPNRYYLNAYEMILMLRKGKAKNINNMGTKNVLQINNIIGNKLHPTEKPVGLMKILIENSTVGGDLVIDPFMGAGSTGVACKELGRDFIGIEIDEKYFKIAQKRIEDTEETKDKSQMTIFDILEE
jgi:site-specific DNA-methyltransferase (adenine-specific)